MTGVLHAFACTWALPGVLCRMIIKHSWPVADGILAADFCLDRRSMRQLLLVIVQAITMLLIAD